MALSHNPGQLDVTLDARVRHPNYGLGVVEELDFRQVTVEFDSGQRQTCPLSACELTRVIWAMNELVMVRSKGLAGKVLDVIPHGDVFRYKVQLSISGDVVVVAEGGLSDLGHYPPPPDPLEALRLRRFEHPELFYVRSVAHYLACSRQALVSSGATARIDPLPHQIFVARRVVTAPRPRFLLADEVGLGKTIEAGLIIQELRARGALGRVLAIVPANLTFQWSTELEQKFNERFAVYDSSVLRELRAQNPRSNPWLARDNIILSHGFIEHNERLWDEIAGLPWDMVVVDEAHHARRRRTSGDRQEATQLYRFVSRLSERTRGLLLLTATPMQLQTFELFSLVELLDCGLFESFEHFEAQRLRNRSINELIKALDTCDQTGVLDRELRGDLRAQLGREHSTLIDQASSSAAARERLTQLLAERHLLSEVMIRNRKRVIGMATRRHPRILPVELSPEERRLYEAVTSYVRDSYSQLDQRRRGVVGFLLVAYQRRLTSCTHAFRVTIDRRLQKLRAQMAQLEALPGWSDDEDLDDILGRADQVAFGTDPAAIAIERRGLEELRSLADDIPADTKFLAFHQFLSELFARNPGEQVLVFTQFYDTLHYLQGQLRSRWKVGTFHGSLNPKEKDFVIAQFRDGATQILISTEAGGEGRNLQFCAVLVNYDLPWNPMKVEQRIGRVDRIGQTRDVLICNFAQRGTVEDRVLDMLTHRIHIFEETVGGLDPILGELEADIQKIVLETPLGELDAALERRATQLERDTERARQVEEAQRDFVVDLRSFDRHARLLFDPDEQRRILEAMRAWGRLMLKQVGAQAEPQPDGSLVVRLGKASGGILPEVRQRFFELTFDYDQAMERQGLEYGSFGHPLFDALIAYGTAEAFAPGVVAQRTVRSNDHSAFSGFQFNFLVEEQSIHRTRSLITIAVDDAGIYRPDLEKLLLESRDWEQPVQGVADNTGDDWAERVERAHDRAFEELERMLRDRRAARKAEVEPQLLAEEQRLNRYYDMRLRSGQEKLAHDQAILQRLQWSGREEDRKVVPIWRRNVENAEAYLRSLAQERETQLRELAGRRRVTYSSSLLNAARVTVVVPLERSRPSFLLAARDAAAETSPSAPKPRVRRSAPPRPPVATLEAVQPPAPPTIPPPVVTEQDLAPTLVPPPAIPAPMPDKQAGQHVRKEKGSLLWLPPPSSADLPPPQKEEKEEEEALPDKLRGVVDFIKKKLRKLF